MILEKQLRRFARRCWVTTRRHPLLPFLLAATLAFDAVLVMRENNAGAIKDTLFFCQVYCLLSQCCLLGIWLVQCLKGFATRLLIVCLSLTVFYNLLYLRFYSDLENDKSFPVILATFVAIGSTTSLVSRMNFLRQTIVIPRFNVRSLLLLSTSIAVTTAVMRNLDFSHLHPWRFFLYAPIAIMTWKISNWSNTWKRNLLLLLFWPIHLSPFVLWGLLLNGRGFHIDFEAETAMQAIFILTCMYFFVLIWSFGLQYQSRPTRRKREQAALALPEQPVRLHNQDVDQLVSSESIEPDDEANDKEPGPIDLRV